MRFPPSESVAMVVLVVVLAWVDQTMDLVRWFKMTRLPSREIVSSHKVGSAIGLSPLATHSVVNLGSLLNHMPRYQWTVLLKDLLPVWTKLSAYLPLLETILSMPASAWPGEMVSVAA